MVIHPGKLRFSSLTLSPGFPILQIGKLKSICESYLSSRKCELEARMLCVPLSYPVFRKDFPHGLWNDRKN